MNILQLFSVLLLFVSILVSFRAYRQCRFCNASFTPTPLLYFLGIFVWADALVFGPFWGLVAVVSLVTANAWLLGLLAALFWLIRSLGEALYWFLQQFSTVTRNPPEKLVLHKLVSGDAIWFVYQIFWQSVAVFAGVAVILTAWEWLLTLS